MDIKERAKVPQAEISSMREKIAEISKANEALNRRIFALEGIANQKLLENVMGIQRKLDTSIGELNRRMYDVERASTAFSLGSIKIPIDITGLVAAVAMIAIAAIIVIDFNLLRNPSFATPFAISFGIAFIVSVAVKLYLANIGMKRAEGEKIVVK
jgi:hypothetical protein